MWDAVSLTGDRAWYATLPPAAPDGSPWTEGKKEKWAQGEAVSYMTAHPWTTLRRSVLKFADFWGLERDLLAGKLPTAPYEPRTRGARVDEKAVIDELSWIDPSATVKAGAQIVNSVVEANCVVDEKAVVAGSVLRRSTRIGQSAEVRDVIAGMSCHVGRFADVRRVALGDKSVLTDYTIAGDPA